MAIIKEDMETIAALDGARVIGIRKHGEHVVEIVFNNGAVIELADVGETSWGITRGEN